MCVETYRKGEFGRPDNPGTTSSLSLLFYARIVTRVKSLTSTSKNIEMGGKGGSRPSRHVGSFKLRLNRERESSDKLPHVQAKGPSELKTMQYHKVLCLEFALGHFSALDMQVSTRMDALLK